MNKWWKRERKEQRKGKRERKRKKGKNINSRKYTVLALQKDKIFLHEIIGEQ